MTASRTDNSRIIRSPRGPELSAKSWLTEAPLRMVMNNLDPEVAERPQELVVYGGIGRAARRLERVLWNDPGTGVMPHADAGYEIAIDCARENGLNLPSLQG